MLPSTFELCIQPQLPQDLNPLSPPSFKQPSHVAIQGYFLSIANTTSSEVTVTLVFTATPPAVDVAQPFAFADVTGVNLPTKLTRETAPGKVRFTVPISANDVCLFILKPDTSKNNEELMKVANFRICGRVEIFVSSFSVLRFNRLMLALEHPEISSKDLTASNPQLDQTVYTFSTANGDSFFNLSNSTLRGLEGVLSPQSLDVLNISQLCF